MWVSYYKVLCIKKSCVGLPIRYSVIVALTGLPIGYSVIVALTGLPIGYGVIVVLTGHIRIHRAMNVDSLEGRK